MYSSTCPNCGEKSDPEIQYCPVCGAAKSELVTEGSIFKDINDKLVEKLSFLDYPQLYATVITRLALMLIVIFVIPDFISNSEFFWMVIGIFSVYGLIKEVAKTYKKFIIVYKICRTLLFAYFGAGFGNIIAHSGRMAHYRFSYYFNINFLYEQLLNGNKMIVVGMIGGIGIMILYYKLGKQLEFRQ